jgi:hypothetical protein
VLFISPSVEVADPVDEAGSLGRGRFPFGAEV